MSDATPSARRSTRQTLGRLIGYARPYGWRVLLAVLTFTATGAIVLAMGRGVRTLIDHGVRHGRGELNPVALELLILVAFYSVAAFGRAYLSASLAERLATDVLQRALARKAELSMTLRSASRSRHS